MDNLPEIIALRLQREQLTVLLHSHNTKYNSWQELYKVLQQYEKDREEKVALIQAIKDNGTMFNLANNERDLGNLESSIAQTQTRILQALLYDIPKDEIRAELKRIEDREREIMLIELERAKDRQRKRLEEELKRL